MATNHLLVSWNSYSHHKQWSIIKSIIRIIGTIFFLISLQLAVIILIIAELIGIIEEKYED